MTTEERERLLKKQRDLCERKGYPHFAPNDGICDWCRADMVELQKDAYEKDLLITGCNHGCQRSYCD